MLSGGGQFTCRLSNIITFFHSVKRIEQVHSILFMMPKYLMLRIICVKISIDNKKYRNIYNWAF